MDIYLIRHAESELNRDRTRIGGRSSWCELNEQGKQQSRALGAALARRHITFDRVIASTSIRAQQTARYALEAAGARLASIEVVPQIVELNMGHWEGELRQEVYSPEVIAQASANPWEFAPPGGESPREAAARLQRFILTDVLTHTHHQRVALISHGLTLRAFLSLTFNWPLDRVQEVEVRNTSLHVLRYTSASAHPTLLIPHDVSHLDEASVPSLPGKAHPTSTDAEQG